MFQMSLERRAIKKQESCQQTLTANTAKRIQVTAQKRLLLATNESLSISKKNEEDTMLGT
jgi:hypothetical protein